MSFDFSLFSLGPLTIPFIVLALVVLVIVIERCLAIVIALNKGSKFSKQQLTESLSLNAKQFVDQIQPNRLALSGIFLLLSHQHQPKAVREEIASVWLYQKRKKLAVGSQLLKVIIVFAPLLGLFGTVLGLIQVFDDIARSKNVVEPALLADGLGLAMHTTAAGLLIALLAIVGSYGLSAFVSGLLSKVEISLSQFNLFLEGVDWKSDTHRNSDFTSLKKQFSQQFKPIREEELL